MPSLITILLFCLTFVVLKVFIPPDVARVIVEDLLGMNRSRI